LDNLQKAWMLALPSFTNPDRIDYFTQFIKRRHALAVNKVSAEALSLLLQHPPPAQLGGIDVADPIRETRYRPTGCSLREAFTIPGEAHLAEKVGWGFATTPPGDFTSPTRQTPRR